MYYWAERKTNTLYRRDESAQEKYSKEKNKKNKVVVTVQGAEGPLFCLRLSTHTMKLQMPYSSLFSRKL